MEMASRSECVDRVARVHTDVHIDVHVPKARVSVDDLRKSDVQRHIDVYVEEDGRPRKLADDAPVTEDALVAFVEYDTYGKAPNETRVITRTHGADPRVRAACIHQTVLSFDGSETVLLLPFDPQLLPHVTALLDAAVGYCDMQTTEEVAVVLRRAARQGGEDGSRRTSSYAADARPLTNVSSDREAYLYLPERPENGEPDRRRISVAGACRDEADRPVDVLVLVSVRARGSAATADDGAPDGDTARSVFEVQRGRLEELKPPERTEARFSISVRAADTILNSPTNSVAAELHAKIERFDRKVLQDVDELQDAIDRVRHREALRDTKALRLAALPPPPVLEFSVTPANSAGMVRLNPTQKNQILPSAVGGLLSTFVVKGAVVSAESVPHSDRRLPRTMSTEEYCKLAKHDNFDPNGRCFFLVRATESGTIVPEYKLSSEKTLVRMTHSCATVRVRHLEDALRLLTDADTQTSVVEAINNIRTLRSGPVSRDALFRLPVHAASPRDVMIVELRDRQDTVGVALLVHVLGPELAPSSWGGVDPSLERGRDLVELVGGGYEAEGRAIESPVSVDAETAAFGVRAAKGGSVATTMLSAVVEVLGVQFGPRGLCFFNLKHAGEPMGLGVGLRRTTRGATPSLCAFAVSDAAAGASSGTHDLARQPVLFSNTTYRFVSAIVQPTFVELLMSNGERISLPRTPAFRHSRALFDGHLGPIPIGLLDDRVRCEEHASLQTRTALPRVGASTTGMLEPYAVRDLEAVPWLVELRYPDMVIDDDPLGVGKGGEGVRRLAFDEAEFARCAARLISAPESTLLLLVDGGRVSFELATDDAHERLATARGRELLRSRRARDETVEALEVRHARTVLSVDVDAAGVALEVSIEPETFPTARHLELALREGLNAALASAENVDAADTTVADAADLLGERAALGDLVAHGGRELLVVRAATAGDPRVELARPRYVRGAEIKILGNRELHVTLQVVDPGATDAVAVRFGLNGLVPMRCAVRGRNALVFTSMALGDAGRRVCSVDRRVVVVVRETGRQSPGVCLLCASTSDGGATALCDDGEHGALGALRREAARHPRSLVYARPHHLHRNTVVDPDRHVFASPLADGRWKAHHGARASNGAYDNDVPVHTPEGVFPNCGYELVPVSCEEAQAVRDCSDLQIAAAAVSEPSVDGASAVDAPEVVYEFMRMPSLNRRERLEDCVRSVDAQVRRVAYTAPHLAYPVATAPTDDGGARVQSTEARLDAHDARPFCVDPDMCDASAFARALGRPADAEEEARYWRVLSERPVAATDLGDATLARRLLSDHLASGSHVVTAGGPPSSAERSVRAWHCLHATVVECQPWSDPTTRPRGEPLALGDALAARLQEEGSAAMSAEEASALLGSGGGSAAAGGYVEAAGLVFTVSRSVVWFQPVDPPRRLDDRVLLRRALIHEVADPRLWAVVPPGEAGDAAELRDAAAQRECFRTGGATYATRASAGGGGGGSSSLCVRSAGGKVHKARTMPVGERLSGYVFVTTGCSPVRNLPQHIERCGGRVASTVRDAPAGRRTVLVRGYDPCDVWRWSKRTTAHTFDAYPGLICRSAALDEARARGGAAPGGVLVMDAFDLWTAMTDPNPPLAAMLRDLCPIVRRGATADAPSVRRELRAALRGCDERQLDDLVDGAAEALAEAGSSARAKFAKIAAMIPTEGMYRALERYVTNACVADVEHAAVGDLLPVHGVGPSAALRLSTGLISVVARALMTRPFGRAPPLGRGDVLDVPKGAARLHLSSIQHLPHACDADPRHEGVRAPRAALERFDALLSELGVLPPGVTHELLGSFRRGVRPDCGHVELLLVVDAHAADAAAEDAFDDACQALAVRCGAAVLYDGRRLHGPQGVELSSGALAPLASACAHEADERSLLFYAYRDQSEPAPAPRAALGGRRFVIDVDADWAVQQPTDPETVRRLCASTDTIVRRDRRLHYWNRSATGGAAAERIVFLDRGRHVRHAVVLLDGRYRRLDVRWARRGSSAHACMQLRFTGSREHNAAMRAHARRRGLVLDDRSLTLNGKELGVATERDVFDRIGLPYRPPAQREAATATPPASSPPEPHFRAVAAETFHAVRMGDLKKGEARRVALDPETTVEGARALLEELVEAYELDLRDVFVGERDDLLALARADLHELRGANNAVAHFLDGWSDATALTMDELELAPADDEAGVLEMRLRFWRLVRPPTLPEPEGAPPAAGRGDDDGDGRAYEEGWLVESEAARVHPSSIARTSHGVADGYVHVGVGTTFSFPRNAPGLRIRVGRTHCVEWVAQHRFFTDVIDERVPRTRLREALSGNEYSDLDYDLEIDRVAVVDLDASGWSGRAWEQVRQCASYVDDDQRGRLYLLASRMHDNPLFRRPGVACRTTLLERGALARIRIFARDDAEEPPVRLSASELMLADATTRWDDLRFVKRTPVRSPTVCVENVLLPDAQPTHTVQGCVGRADVSRHIAVRSGRLFIDGHLRNARWMGAPPDDLTGTIEAVQAAPGGVVEYSHGPTRARILNPPSTLRAADQTLVRWYESLVRVLRRSA